MNKGRNFTLQYELSEISGPKHTCVKIYKRRCLILSATKRTEWLMSCVQQTGTQSQSVFVTCCHLPGKCSTTHHIVATDEYLKERETVPITGVDLYLGRGVDSHHAAQKHEFSYKILSNVLMCEQLTQLNMFKNFMYNKPTNALFW
jgi:hypothetical protein